MAAEQSLLVFHAGQWEPLAGELQNLDMVGINATADAVNRLAVAGEAVLLNHDGAGHQVKINKADSGDTASLLFQTGFSGRAEMGTAGDDDFHFKVSGDGASWHEAIVIDRDTGEVAFPNTPFRERLAADRTYYVRTDGDDANDGLANTSGGAFATIQHAINTAYGIIDLGPYNVTIQLGDGTYSQSLLVNGPHVGAGTITIAGNAGSPGSTVIERASPANYAVTVTNGAALYLRNLELRSTVNTLIASASGRAYVQSGVRFSGNAGAGTVQILAQVGGMAIVQSASYAVLGNAAWHWRALLGGQISAASAVVDVSGRTFATAFAQAERLGMISALGASFSGSAAGKRYAASLNGLVFTGSGNPNALPGDVAGTTETGGQYV